MLTSMSKDNYDVIIIGSGLGGMTCGTLLARLEHRRVLVLEKHFKLGGQTHEFQRNGFEWDIGLHYVGFMGNNDPPRRFMDFLTGGTLDWNRMPEDFDVLHYPDLRFAIPGHEDTYRARLKDTFPKERDNIDAYFSDVHTATRWMGMEMMRKAMPNWLATLSGMFGHDQRALALQTTKQYLEGRFEDPILRSVLASQWPDYGLSPDESAFGIHALVSGSYFGGGYYPVGGAQSIAPGMIAGIEAAGGQALVNQDVIEIVIEKGRAVGVRAKHPRRAEEPVEYRAPLIVSNVGARTTFLKLVPNHVELAFRDELARFRHGHSAVTCYLGLTADPKSIGVQGENHWVYTGFDHDEMRRSTARVLQGDPPCLLASFASGKAPSSTAHTAQLIIMVDGQSFSAWRNSDWKHRPAEYEAVKAAAKGGLLTLAETALPGLTDLVDYAEVSTPMTIEHFTSWPLGAFYGIPAVPDRYRRAWTQIETPIPGLYLTGSDVASLGIPGATMGGAFTAARLLGTFGIPRVMRNYL